MGAMADFFDTLDKVCHMFTSRQVIDKENEAKSALGAFLDWQIPLLKKLYKYSNKKGVFVTLSGSDSNI